MRVAIVLIALSLSPLATAIDADGDGMCDVWQARYHAQALVADEDSDGDGQNNRAEAISGTDPLDARSVFTARITNADESVSVAAVTLPGKRYQLFHAPSPNGPWTAVGDPQTSSGDELLLSAPSSGERRFYRVAATDADGDGDGVSDWAEMQLAGFDPAEPDSFGITGGDLAAVHDWLAQLDGGQLVAGITQAAAYEKEAAPAVVTYTRSGEAGRPFTVFLKTKGPAHSARSAAGPGEWFFADGNGQPLTDRLVIPAGELSAELRIHPVADALVEVPEHLGIMVGGTNLESLVTLADAAPTAANQRLLVAYLRPCPAFPRSAPAWPRSACPATTTPRLVAVSFSNLNSPVNSTQVLTENAAILQSVPPFNYGGQPWAIRASQNFLTDQAVLDALLSGSIQLGIYTEAHVNGEISGVFQITSGSTEFQTPPDPQPVESLTGDALDRDIVRFLTQATFGPTPEDMQALRDLVAGA
jgi:hypothetical protein